MITSERKGKAYANRKKESERPVGDYYPTPKSLLWALGDVFQEIFPEGSVIFEPCSGEGSLSHEMKAMGYDVIENDISHSQGVDYLTNHFEYRQIVTNPPFSQWDDFVTKMKSEADKVLVIGRLNYFGTQSRYERGIWDGLKEVHIFTRYVDYQTPLREDGNFHVGAMATAWFLFERDYKGNPEIHFCNVQPWAKLGGFKK